MLIKGADLSEKQRQQVLTAYVHRGHAIGVGKHYADEQAWLVDHAFHFLKDGSRLSRTHRFCEPHYIAD